MAIFPTLLLSCSKPLFLSHKKPLKPNSKITRNFPNCINIHTKKTLIGAGFAVTTTPLFVGIASAAATELPLLQIMEPSNALSLPTWAIHVSSVVEW